VEIQSIKDQYIEEIQFTADCDIDKIQCKSCHDIVEILGTADCDIDKIP
jgi:hypothetical protein